jgi:hemolysin activation/secretion protein
MRRVWITTVLAALGTPVAATGQTALDRSDPTLIERTLPAPAEPEPTAAAPIGVERPAPATDAAVTGVVNAVTVEGQDVLPPAVFADAIATRVGQEMTRADLSALAGAIAAVARAQGYPFATAQVPAQSLANGILRVSLDLGRIDAVRVIGARNVAADKLLGAALATGRPVRQAELERALLLVGDLPGVRVKESRLMRQDGFGILLVTIESDRAAAYLQLDNRGSKEVGPFRSTALASLRDVTMAGDEVTFIVSQTPFQPREFAFVRGRYAAPLGASGTRVTVSGSIARSHPGGALAALDVRGKSADAALGVQYPLLRERAASLWAGAELRALGTGQDLSGRRLRRDRLATLTASLGGTAGVLGGALRGELAGVFGLPVGDVTREGSPLASRLDGDARFVAANYTLDWTRSLGKPFSLVLASAGQVASRPLLATMEFGLGGPMFGRGYDYAERTGEQGIAGSVEMRADVGAIEGSVVDRAQLYGFFDGGTVGNLRDGAGGGSLVSTGAGVRVGTGRFDWLAEIALPVNADRFDTGDRRPRVSLRVARVF